MTELRGAGGQCRRGVADAFCGNPAPGECPSVKAHRRACPPEARGPDAGPLLQDPRRLQLLSQGAGRPAAEAALSSAPRPAIMRKALPSSAGISQAGRCLHAGDDPAAEDRQDAALRRRVRRDPPGRRLFRRLLPRRARLLPRRTAAIWCRPSTTRTSSRARRPSPMRSPTRCRAARMPDIIMLPVGGGGLSAGVTRYFRDQGRDTALRLLRAGRRAEPEAEPRRRAAREARQGRQFRRRRGGRRDRPRAVPPSQAISRPTTCG